MSITYLLFFAILQNNLSVPKLTTSPGRLPGKTCYACHKLNPTVKKASSVAGFQMPLANKGREKESVILIDFCTCKLTSDTANPLVPPL